MPRITVLGAAAMMQRHGSRAWLQSLGGDVKSGIMMWHSRASAAVSSKTFQNVQVYMYATREWAVDQEHVAMLDEFLGPGDDGKPDVSHNPLLLLLRLPIATFVLRCTALRTGSGRWTRNTQRCSTITESWNFTVAS